MFRSERSGNGQSVCVCVCVCPQLPYVATGPIGHWSSSSYGHTKFGNVPCNSIDISTILRMRIWLAFGKLITHKNDCSLSCLMAIWRRPRRRPFAFDRYLSFEWMNVLSFSMFSLFLSIWWWCCYCCCCWCYLLCLARYMPIKRKWKWA